MKRADFQNLLQGIREASSYLRGNKRAASRIDRIDPDSVTAIRTKLRLSQKAFSSAFGISPATLRNWEQGRRKPTGAARVLLRVLATYEGGRQTRPHQLLSVGWCEGVRGASFEQHAKRDFVQL